MRNPAVMLLLVSAPVVAPAGEWLDELRSIDLNDYSLGLAVTAQQNPYVGGENSTFAYPYLTSFEHPSMTDKLLVMRDGELALRRITDDGWEYWIAGRVRTLGFGNSDSDALRGVEAPKWAVEIGPGIGFRRWPVQFHLSSWFEPTDRHSGASAQLSLSYPLQHSRGYLVPEVAGVYQDSAYTDYYFGVSDEEMTAARPEYVPGSATNAKFRIAWGYRLGRNWLLSGRVSYELLASEIRNSPIVGRDHTWSANLGVAYDPGVFRDGSLEAGPPDPQRFDFRFGIFNARVDSKVGRYTSGGVPGDEVDLEDMFGESDKENVAQLDAYWRLNRYHRIEAGYFELVRSGDVTIDDELRHGDSLFSAGTTLTSRSHFKSFRVGYAYSLIRDQQKELALMGGVHFSSFDAIIAAPEDEVSEKSRLDAPLPVFGIHFSVNLAARITVAANAHLFRTDFDDYEGSLNYFAVEVRKRFAKQINAGIGFNYYRTKLRSRNEELNGYVDIEHRGPVLFLGYEF